MSPGDDVTAAAPAPPRRDAAARNLNWLIALVITGGMLYVLAPILTPFVSAALLAYIGDPLADRLQRLRLPRTLAVLVVFLLTFITFGLLVLLVLPMIRMQVGALLDALPGIIAQIERDVLPLLGNLLGVEGGGQDFGLAPFIERYRDLAGDWGTALLVSLSRSGGALAAAVISLFLIPILTFYLLRDWDWITAHLATLLPSRHRPTIVRLARETDEVLGAFLRGQLLVMAALAALYSVGLKLAGLEFAVAIGVVSGLLSFVPYLGLIFGVLLASLTAIVEPEPMLRLVGVVVTFGVAQFIEGSVLTPKLVGDRIGLHPVMVIFAVAAGGQLFGFFGVLLALPAAATLSVIVRFLYGRFLAEHPEVESQLEEIARSEGRDD